MPPTPYTQFRLGERTLADLSRLATSAGSITQALREATAYFAVLVAEAGRQNAEELSEEDWIRLAHLNQPDSPLPSESRDEDDRAAATDWARRLAIELVGQWEGRPLVLPLHRQEAADCKKLATKIQGWSLVRGYALLACLRHFWHKRILPRQWWLPEVWLAGKEFPGKEEG